MCRYSCTNHYRMEKNPTGEVLIFFSILIESSLDGEVLYSHLGGIFFFTLVSDQLSLGSC